MEFLTYMYKFEAFIERLQLNLRKSKQLSVVWRKGKKSVETEKYSGYARGIMVIQESLHLSLKLYKDPNTHEFQPKFSTFAVVEHQNDRRRVIMEAKFNLLEMLAAPSKDFTLVFAHGEVPGRMVFRGRQQLIMELNHFRFNTQELEESGGQPSENQEPAEEAFDQAFGEEEAIALRKEIEDLNYLNGKLKNDREKLLLRIREVEFEFKEKEKLVLREIRHAKTYFEKKIKIRENVYQEEIEKLVSEANEEQATFARVQEQLREEIRELRARLSKAQEDLLLSREESSKLRYELEERAQQLKLAAIEKAQEEKRVSEVIENMENEILKCQGELRSMVGHLSDEKDSVQKEFGSKLQELSQNLTSEIEKKLKDIADKDRRIAELDDVVAQKDYEIGRLNDNIKSIESLFNSTRMQLTKVEVDMEDASRKIQTLTADNRQLEEGLKATEEQLLQAKSSNRETKSRLEDTEADAILLREEIAKLKETFENKELELNTDIDQLRQALQEKHNEFYEIKERERTLDGEKEGLELDIKNMTELRTLDAARIAHVEQENATLEMKYKEKVDEMEARQEEYAAAENAMADLRNDLHLMELSKEDALIEVEKLKKAMKQKEDLHQKQIELINAELQKYEISSRLDQRDVTIEGLYDQIKAKEGEINKLNKRIKDLVETVNILKRKEQNTSIDKDIMAEIAHITSRDHSEMEEFSNELIETLRKEVMTLRKDNHFLKKDVDSKDKLIKQYKETHGDMRQSMNKVEEMKHSIEVMRSEGLEQMKQTLLQKDQIITQKENELATIRQEADERIDELEVQVQKYMIETEEKDAKIRALNRKLGNAPSADVAIEEEARIDNTKLKEVIKQLNKDHEAEREQLMKEITNLEATVEELRKSQVETPAMPRSQPDSAKGNFSFMPEGRLSSPRGGSNDSEMKNRIKELERKLQAAETEKNRLTGMVEDMQKHVSIIRENTNEQDHSEDQINNLFKGQKGEDGKRKKSQQAARSPRSATQPQHLNTVESERTFRPKDTAELVDLQNQMARMRITHDEEIMRLNRQLVEKENSCKEMQTQLTAVKEKEIESRFAERELKMKDEAIQAQKEKRRELEQKLNEDTSSRNRQIEKLQEQVRNFNTQYSNHMREIEKYRMTAELKERQLVEARKSREDLAREFKEHKQSEKREAKRQYEEPTEVRLREVTKELTKMREVEYELKSQLERVNEQRKERYVKLSDHKEMKSEYERLLKDKTIECESLQKQIQEATQYRTKADYTMRTLESEVEETRRRIAKLQDEHKSALEEKDTDVRLAKKKMASMERQQEDHESKIAQFQERQKFLGLQHEKMLDELNKKIMQQLRQALTLKEQNEIVCDELKGWKKRHAEAVKSQSDLEDRLSLQSRQVDELKRANEKLHKQIDDKQQQLNRGQLEIRKNADESRRQQLLKEDLEREKRELEQQIQKMEKMLAAQELEVKRLTREMDKVRNKVAETEEDQFSSTKNTKLQMERQEEVRRKLEKALEQKDRQIAASTHRMHKLEEEKKEAVDSLNELYTDKLSLYVNQIDSIKKTIHEYEDEIAYLKTQNRETIEELQKTHLRLNSLETELKICSESLDAKIIELNFKREESDRLKQEKYELELVHGKLSTEVTILTEDGRKLVEKLSKMSELNRAHTDENQKLQMEVRVLKNNQQKLEYEVGQLRPYPQRCREYEAMLRKLEAEREDLIEDMKHKNELVYSQLDFEKYQDQLKSTMIKDKELEVEEALREHRQEAEQTTRKLEIELVEMMNESSRLRADLERAKEHNASILAENIRMIEYERQASDLGKRVVELEVYVKERERQIQELRAANDKSLKDINVVMAALEKELHTAKNERAEMERQLLRGRKSQEDQVESLKRTEEKGMEALQKVNEDLRNKMMQIEFENARLRENEIAVQGAYEKRLGDLQRREEEKLKSIELGYAGSIHRYESETERLKSMLDDLKYVIEDKNNEINFRREEIEYYEVELAKLNDQLKRTKAKMNQEKEVYSLELFKIGSRLKENDDQWSLKVKRLEDELSRVTNQLVQTSSRVERELTYSKLRVNDPEDKQTRKFEEKLKLKEKTIEQLKQQVLVLEEKVFKSEQELLTRIPDNPGLVVNLRSENDKLRDELRELQTAAKEAVAVQKLELEVITLAETSANYKKEMTRAKKAEQDLQEQLDAVTLNLEAAVSQVNFLRGYESTYKELKVQYEKINYELRLLQAEGHMSCEMQREMLEKEKQELDETVRDLQQKVGQLTSQKLAREMLPKKQEAKEDTQTAARIRQSLNQYREELNKRQAILNREMDLLKERNSALLEKVKKVELERDESNRKAMLLNQQLTEVNEENIRNSEEIFRLNSNIMKEEFTHEDVREGLQAKWESLNNITMVTVNMRLEEGLAYLVNSYHQLQSVQEEFRVQREDYERKLYQLADQNSAVQERLEIREEEFKFERERDSLDIEELTKQTERLQQRINDLEHEVQSHQNLQIEFERVQYEYNNCKILLDVCRAELEELRGNLQVENQTFLPKEQIVEDLEDILSKVHQH